MSSILKALRKLEEEKAALGEGGADLSRDILKRSAPQRSRGNLLILKFALGIVLSLALLALLWILLGSTEHIETVAIPAVVETADSHQKAPPAPAPQAVQEQPVVERQSLSELVPPQKALTEEPIKVMTTAVDDPKIVEVEIEPVVIPSPDAKIVETVKKPIVVVPPSPAPEVVEVVIEPLLEPAAPALVISEQTPQAEPAPAVTPQPAVPQAESSSPEQVLPSGFPELWVSAIAFKPLPGERLAVVNDLPVMEGTSIEGVQVIEILEAGVRFSWQGVEFILPLTDEPPQK